MNEKNRLRGSRAPRAGRGLLSGTLALALVLVAALALALAPAGAFANAASAAADASEATTLPRFVDEETRPTPPVDPDDVSEHTMTFYYYEPLSYEDPDYSDPSGIRLLKKRVVTGLKAGQELDTADYVEDIEGHVFFDAYPAKPVVSSDESLNYVELVYFKTQDNACTVNYFEVKGAPGAVVGSSDIVVEKMGSFTIDNQRFDQKIEGRQVAAPLDEMVYLDSYPESIRLKADPEENVLNVFYAPALATLPDSVAVPEDQPEPSDPALPDVDAPDAGAPDEPPADDGSDDPAQDVPPVDDGSDEPPAEDGSDDPADPPATDAPPAGGSSADSEASSGADEGSGADAAPDGSGSTGSLMKDATSKDAAAQASELPQTGDPLLAALVGTLAAVAAAVVALVASRRRLLSSRG